MASQVAGRENVYIININIINNNNDAKWCRVEMALHSNGGGVLWFLGHRGKAGFVAVGLTTGCSNQHLQIPNAEQPIWSS